MNCCEGMHMGGMMIGMSVLWILVVIVLVLASVALIKYIRQK